MKHVEILLFLLEYYTFKELLLLFPNAITLQIFNQTYEYVLVQNTSL